MNLKVISTIVLVVIIDVCIKLFFALCTTNGEVDHRINLSKAKSQNHFAWILLYYIVPLSQIFYYGYLAFKYFKSLPEK